MDTPRQVKRNEKKYPKKGRKSKQKPAINSVEKVNVQFLPETNKIVYNLKTYPGFTAGVFKQLKGKVAGTAT